MFIVIASKKDFQANLYNDCKVQDEKDKIPSTHQEVFRALTEKECIDWAAANEGKAVPLDKQPAPGGSQPQKSGDGGKRGNVGGGGGGQNSSGDNNAAGERDPRWFWVSVGQNVLLTIVVVFLMYILYYGITSDLLNGDTSDERARNLITFLVAFGTIFIAVLAVLTGMFIREKERFSSAKEVLAILVGILGTIVGFYYGQSAGKNANPDASNAAQIKVSDPTFEPSTLIRSQNANISFNISGGTKPYHYKITIPEANASIENNSNTGAVRETFKADVAANVNAVTYSIEGTDKANKTFESKNANTKIPVQ
jgi:uncharacterized protein YpmB